MKAPMVVTERYPNMVMPAAKAPINALASWGGQLLRATPWGRVATLAMGAGLWAYERGLLDPLFPVRGDAKRSHALLGRPSGMSGGEEAVPMVPNSATVLGGAPLPQSLSPAVQEGKAEVQRWETLGVHVGADQVQAHFERGGFATLDSAKTDHVLWQVGDDLHGASDSGAQGVDRPRRLAMIDHPNAPKPKRDFVSQVKVYPGSGKNTAGFGYGFQSKDGVARAYILGEVEDGVMVYLEARSIGGDPASRPSGTELFANSLQALRSHGVEVFEVKDEWPTTEGYRSNTDLFDRALQRLGVTRETATQEQLREAARWTLSGFLFSDYALQPMHVRINRRTGSVITWFANPQQVETHGALYRGVRANNED